MQTQTHGSSREPQFKLPRPLQLAKERREQQEAEQRAAAQAAENRDPEGASDDGQTPPQAGAPNPEIPPPGEPGEGQPHPPPEGGERRARREQDATYWRNRHLVTQGMLERERRERRADTDRHRDEVASLNQRITQLQAELLASQQRGAQPPMRHEQRGTQQRDDDDAATASEAELLQSFTPEEIEVFGREQCLTVARTSMRAAGRNQRRMQELIEQAVQPLRERAAREDADRARDLQQQQREALDAFYAKVGTIVPNFLEIDETDRWKAWLKLRDSATGLVRQTLLKSYVEGADHQRTAAMFKAYLADDLFAEGSEQPGPRDAAGDVPPQEQQPPARREPPVAPGAGGARGGASHGRPPPAQGAPSSKEIREHFKLRALRKVSKTEMEAFDQRLKLLNSSGQPA